MGELASYIEPAEYELFDLTETSDSESEDGHHFPIESGIPNIPVREILVPSRSVSKY